MEECPKVKNGRTKISNKRKKGSPSGFSRLKGRIGKKDFCLKRRIMP